MKVSSSSFTDITINGAAPKNGDVVVEGLRGRWRQRVIKFPDAFHSSGVQFGNIDSKYHTRMDHLSTRLDLKSS